LNEYGNRHDCPSIPAALDIKDETDGKSNKDKIVLLAEQYD